MKILILSDTHFPAQNLDYWPYIKKIKALTKWDRIIHIGDLVDFSSVTFHSVSGETDNPTTEVERARVEIKKLEKLFPKMDIMYGNHDIRVIRKAESMGIPRSFLKDLNKMFEIKAKWKWHDKLIVKLPNGNDVFFTHHFKSSVLQSSKELGCSLVVGHQHTQSSYSMWSSPLALNFAMCVGSSINPKAENFRYSKNFIKRPIISVASIGYIGYCQPCIHTMPLNNKGRWTGKV